MGETLKILQLGNQIRNLAHLGNHAIGELLLQLPFLSKDNWDPTENIQLRGHETNETTLLESFSPLLVTLTA